MKIERFEDILAWQESRKLVRKIYKMTIKSRELNNDLRFKSQITSAALSIMSNIAEGFSRDSNKEFKRFLFIAKGSVAEVQSQLYAAVDLEYIDQSAFKESYCQLEKIARLLSKFITYLKKTPQTQRTQQTL